MEDIIFRTLFGGVLVALAGALAACVWYGGINLVDWWAVNRPHVTAIDWVKRVVLRPDRVTSQRCTECGAGVGQDCVNPFCYGSLGDVPRGDVDATTAVERATVVMRAYTGRRAATFWDEELLAAAIADLMHLARESDIEPYDLIDRAGNYYTADVTEGGIVLAAAAR